MRLDKTHLTYYQAGHLLPTPQAPSPWFQGYRCRPGYEIAIIYDFFIVYSKLGAETGHQAGLASAEVVEFVGERRAEATVGESGAGAPLG
jgi:hypothetical protein